MNRNGRSIHRSTAPNGRPRVALVNGESRPTLITGGCGFIGTNLADHLLSRGERVILFDNLSRAGVERNLRWLRHKHGEVAELIEDDVRDMPALRHAVSRAGSVFHLAAQVAVTTSLTDAIGDFEINARGTLNLLEAVREQDRSIPIVFTSTNKVYGALPDVPLSIRSRRYEPEDAELRRRGISEQRPLDCQSPYGCSKGCADQYVIDYARTFGLPAVVFRMSCIYGPHQHGNEDQGWVAHFLIQAMRGRPITIYGDGMQVRDVLYMRDLVEAFVLAREQIAELGGRAFNIGGGPANAVSLMQLLDEMQVLLGYRPQIRQGPWRPGDQRYYVSDTSRFSAATGWGARHNVPGGLRRLYQWLKRSMVRGRDEMPGRDAGPAAATANAPQRSMERV